MKPTRIFICYRREDTLDFAGRLHDRLSTRYGPTNVVLDVDNVPIGVHFQKYLDSQIQQCDLLLALIGRHWLDSSADGERRLDNPRDFVRIEIESALQRELPIIPVRVGGADMPKESDLPPSIASLSFINAAEIASNRDFNVHVEILVKAIDSLVHRSVRKTRLAPEPPPPATAAPAPRRARPAAAPAAPVLAPTLPEHPVTPAEKIMASLRLRLERWKPKTAWVWKNVKGWWSVRESSNSKSILRARPAKNLVRIRIRKNMDRPRKKSLTLVFDNWIADSPESIVRDEQQLDYLFKILQNEWS